jgi:uncharacterized protein
MKRTNCFLSLAGLLLISLSLQAQTIKIPVLHSRVTDQTGILSSSETQALERILASHEDSTSTQIAVLIIPTLGGDDLFEFTQAVAEKNAIGTREHNNGVLLFVAMNDRKIRIHVGYGLEGALTDATSKQIIEDEILPRFRRQEYYDGILSGIQSIEAAVKGEYTAVQPKRKSIRNFAWPLIIVLGIIFSIISRFARAGGAMVHGRGYRRYSSGMGGFWWGGFGGGGGIGGGGFGGGGGWSGGGGSFGGGGASGSW